jgi:outer membrane protein assembly factor BamD (BamD/ComL family)
MSSFDLPDFDEMVDMTDKIGTLKREVAMFEASLDAKLAEVTRVVTMNKDYWPTAKPPAMNYIKTVYHMEGHTEQAKKELDMLRDNIFTKQGDLKTLELKFQVYRSMIDVWKADQYNKNQSNY